MRFHKLAFILTVFSFFWLPLLPRKAAAESGAPAHTFDLTAALEHALQENPDLKAKRQALGIARGRVQQAELLFQENPA